MSRLRLSIATTDYDHFRDVRSGAVEVSGLELVWSLLGHHEVFARFTAHREWDVAELSFAKFMAQVTRDDADIIGLPVPASRVQRFGSFYVHRGSGIRSAADLAGRRIGSPEWAHTCAVWMRGWLGEHAGVRLDQVHWVQAGTNQAGREEKVELSLPDGVEIERLPDRTLSDMLATGELEAAIIARPPNCFLEGHPDVVRLFPDHEARDDRYHEETGIFPIMHLLAMRRAVLDEHPWVARNLVNAFTQSKDRAVARLLDPAVSRYPVPGLATYAREVTRRHGSDPFPFGIEANRTTLETFCRYASEQGIAHRRMTPDELFPRGIDLAVRI